MKFKTLITLLCAWPLFVCEAGSVRLWSGEVYKGRVTLENNAFAIYPEKGEPARVDLSKVRDAVFIEPAGSSAQTLQRGAILINGTYLAGEPRALQEPVVKIESQDVPATSLAWLVLKPIPRDESLKIPQGRTGAILSGGDFFEGAYTGIKEYRIGINSPLLGPQRFDGGEIGAVVMRNIQDTHATYMVAATNGSRFLADDLKIDQQGIVFQDSVLGEKKIKTTDISEIAPGTGRYQSLGTMQPADVGAPAGVNAVDTFQLHAGDDTIPASLVTRANAALSYAIPAGYQVFASNVAVPNDAPAGTRITFAVYGDGKFILQRSPSMAPGDAPQTLRVNLNNLHTLVIRVEPASLGAENVSGQWIDPMFLRP